MDTPSHVLLIGIVLNLGLSIILFASIKRARTANSEMPVTEAPSKEEIVNIVEDIPTVQAEIDSLDLSAVKSEDWAKPFANLKGNAIEEAGATSDTGTTSDTVVTKKPTRKKQKRKD
jgi:hypothetical protein